MRHFNIPIFIPELACPFRCIYCNQYNISGQCKIPDPQQIEEIIVRHLHTINPADSHVEVAFFGGSFTGLPLEQQNTFLRLVKPWIEKGLVQGIRLSTRPDYISQEILDNLHQHGVTAIELGAQSLDEEVLRRAGRGHTVADVMVAASMIREMGFETGLQMMTGLPGDTPLKSLETARKIISMGAHSTRIYPTLVINVTPLAMLFRQKKYTPQSLYEATDLCAQLYLEFSRAGVKVLRMGLHPSEGFSDGSILLAGPFHPAFGEMVMTKVWERRFRQQISSHGNHISIHVNPSQLNAAIGHQAANKKWLKEQFSKVVFTPTKDIERDAFKIDIY